MCKIPWVGKDSSLLATFLLLSWLLKRVPNALSLFSSCFPASPQFTQRLVNKGRQVHCQLPALLPAAKPTKSEPAISPHTCASAIRPDHGRPLGERSPTILRTHFFPMTLSTSPLLKDPAYLTEIMSQNGARVFLQNDTPRGK